jgi:hypothetical protein
VNQLREEEEEEEEGGGGDKERDGKLAKALTFVLDGNSDEARGEVEGDITGDNLGDLRGELLRELAGDGFGEGAAEDDLDILKGKNSPGGVVESVDTDGDVDGDNELRRCSLVEHGAVNVFLLSSTFIFKEDNLCASERASWK